MPAGNWAAVANYVSAAQAGTAGLEIVSAADARPGDLVAYDWGHGGDFGANGHIGLLASNVEGGAFEAVEGNYQDAVTHTSRNMDDANIVFIRVANRWKSSSSPSTTGPRSCPRSGGCSARARRRA